MVRSTILVVIAIVGWYCVFVTTVGITDDRSEHQSSDATPKSKSSADNPKRSKVDQETRTLNAQPSTKVDSVDQSEIRATGKSYVEAFNKFNSHDAAAHFTDSGEYIDAEGTLFEGRKAIEDLLTALFAANPGCKLELNIDSIRVINPNLAIEDGTSKFTRMDDRNPLYFDYTAVHTKQNGRWLTASVSERSNTTMQTHRNQLRQLDWLVGDWVHEGDDAIVEFSCRPEANGNFLVRTFIVQVAGQESMRGTQRIGWDPQSGKFRAWVFDSDGGFSDGYWHKDGEAWVLKMTGVTSDGLSASSTSIYTRLNANAMTFQSVDHEVAGTELPDSQPVTIVRQLLVTE